MTDLTAILQCPITGNHLRSIPKEQFAAQSIPMDFSGFGTIQEGYVDTSNCYFYPVFEEIIVLLATYAVYIGPGEDPRPALSFDKQRVFDYYNEISYEVKDAMTVYEDSGKWVDYRPVAADYISACFRRAANYFAPEGKYLLDVASGPIGLEEYMSLSNGYDVRICVDISVNALLQARNNVRKAGKKGVFVCGDITNIPLQEGVCDAVLSQHTLYHIPKDDQQTAVEEMYRVAAPGASVVIVYSWFHHSWFMNLSLHAVQLYRIFRHLAGKVYVRLVDSKPRLYFYPHSPGWFRRTFAFGKDIEFYCWRSTNKTFLRMYVHKWLFGKQLLARLQRLEEKHPKFMGKFGDYPVIVIPKK